MTRATDVLMRTVCLTKRYALIALCLCVAMPAAVVAGQAEPKGAAKAGRVSNNYIVQMADDPVVAYKGGIKGLQATKPNKGQKIDPNSPQVVQYAGYLDSRHQDALSTVGGGAEAVRLSVHLQRLCRRAHRGAGRGDRPRTRGAGGEQGRAA